MSSAENSFVSISLVFAQGYKVAYKEIIDRYTQYQGIKVLFKNNVEAAVTNVVATLTSVPSNFTIESHRAELGELGANAQKWSAASYKPDTATATGIRIMLDKRVTQPVGTWKWQLDFTYNGNDYTIEDLPAL